MLQLRDQYPLSSDEIANRSYGHQQVFISIFSIFISVYSVYYISMYQYIISVSMSLNTNRNILQYQYRYPMKLQTYHKVSNRCSYLSLL